MNPCPCGSYAINPHLHGRDPSVDRDVCDVCYWRKRAEVFRGFFGEPIVILPVAELDELKAKVDDAPNPKALQKFCTMVADTLPAGVDWIGKGKPWGCILTRGAADWYCDDCPAKAVCPYPCKQWSQ